jgi:hypothetical protein
VLIAGRRPRQIGTIGQVVRGSPLSSENHDENARAGSRRASNRMQ